MESIWILVDEDRKVIYKRFFSSKKEANQWLDQMGSFPTDYALELSKYVEPERKS